MRWAAVLAGLALLPSLAGAETPPLRIAPASDASLSSMLLLAAAPTAPVVLFDPQDQDVIARARGENPGPVECYARSTTPAPVRALEEDLAGVPCTGADDLLGLAQRWWPSPPAVVVVQGGRYPWLLQGAALAGALGGALLPTNPHHPLAAEALNAWAGAQWYLIGSPPPDVPLPPGARVQRLETLDAVRAASLGALGDFTTLAVANPADRRGRFSPSSLSLLAPRIATVHRAPLVLVSAATADVVEGEVTAAIGAAGRTPTHIYLVGDELALRSHRVPDPVLEAGGPEALGGARDVRVELFSRLQDWQPQDYAVGRFVAEDVARGSATLSRQLAPAGAVGRVVVLSNADQVFALGETISRSTVSELRNAGIKVRASYRDAITPAVIQDALLHAGLLVWEGHARDLTLEERGGIAVERTPPFVVLQGCYTLDRSDPFILFDRGTQSIVATSAAIYSASGSAFARALFDSLLYAGADLGTAVRNARNYLLAVTTLKKQRGHSDWTKTYRAALAFALWGDPTTRPPLATPTSAVPPATWQLSDRALTLAIPPKHLEAATVGPYTAQPVPRAMLSGLILRDGDKPGRTVKELFFTAVRAPEGKTTACPPAPGWEVESMYAPLTRTLSVLVRPPGDTPTRPTPTGSFALPLAADRCP
ncbi:MAG TPA: C25 family cysteine peptidase [Candidatus Dormibacteraeota bacterium]|nr:C25 family cysteine peptidase [Candidatus Dormibacteraeota bacterium]